MDKIDQLAEEEAADRGVPVDTEPEVVPDTEPELLAGKYKTVEELAKGYENVEQLTGRQAAQITELRMELEQLRDNIPPQQQQTMQDVNMEQLLAITPQVLDQWIDSGEITTANAMVIMQAQHEARLQQELDQRLGPLQERTGEAQVERLWNALKAEYGDEVVHRHRDMLHKRVQADPDYLAVDTTTSIARLGDAIAAAEWRSQRAQATPRDTSGRFAQGSVHVEGGSTPPPQQSTPEEDVEPEIAEIRAAKPPSDIFGGIPGRDA